MAFTEHASPFASTAVEQLADDGVLQQYFIELQDVLVTHPNFLLTDRTIAARIMPASLEETIEVREARVNMANSALVQRGLLHVARSKTNYVGDYLPTYAVTDLPDRNIA